MEIYEYGGKRYVATPRMASSPGVGCDGCDFKNSGGCFEAPCLGESYIMKELVDAKQEVSAHTNQSYQQLCVRTCVPQQPREMSALEMDLLHVAMGISTEANELLDNLKKTFYYGKAFDEVNFKEELGDALWYIGMICERMGWQMDDIKNTNIAKLRARYPEKFTEQNAQNRDLAKERDILEGSSVIVADSEEPEERS